MNEFKIADPGLRRMVYALCIMGIIVCGSYTFTLLKNGMVVILNVFTPFIAGLLLAYILSPLVIVLQKKLKLGRIMGTLVVYLIIFFVVFLLIAFIVPTLITEISKMVNALKTSIPDLLHRLSAGGLLSIDADLIKAIERKIMEIEVDYQKIVSAALPGLQKVASGGFETFGKAAKGLIGGIGSVAGFFSMIVFIGIITFYFIIDWEKVRPMIRKMVPLKNRDRLFDVLDKMDIAIGGFLRGQLTVSAIVGCMFAFGLFCMGFIGFPALRNYCFIIGTAAAIGGFIPYLGPIIGVTPAILIILCTGGIALKVKIITLIAVICLFAAIQAIEGFVLQPRIVGKGAGLHPLAVMFALIFGGQFGIGGMMIAVPLASVIRVLVLEFYWLPIEQREAAMTGSGQVQQA